MDGIAPVDDNGAYHHPTAFWVVAAMRSNCDICWVIRNVSYQMEDAEDYTQAEKKEMARQQELRIAKHIVDHHPRILAEINRILGEARL